MARIGHQRKRAEACIRRLGPDVSEPPQSRKGTHVSILLDRTQNVQNRTVFTSLDRATAAFRACLDRLGYSPEFARETCFAIREHQETATLVEMNLLCPEDEAELEEANNTNNDPNHATHTTW